MIGMFTGKYDIEGKKQYTIRSLIDYEFQMHENPGSILIPCGHCLGCRLDHSRQWADRMMLELDSCDRKGLFLTLTYDNDHITWSKFDEFGNPLYGTLVKQDVQLFMKRLRKFLEPRKIRFYLAGEYGDRTFRPHYHCILFGVSLADFPDLVLHGRNELQQSYYISNTLARIWSNGFVLLSDVSWQTCAYVARYVMKKSGDASIVCDMLNQEYPFSLMSRKPGIGRLYLESHPDCLDFDSINISTASGGLKIRIPKYFLKTLEDSDPDRYNELKKVRSEMAADQRLLKLQKTDLSYLEQLEVEENDKLKRIASLKRSSV